MYCVEVMNFDCKQIFQAPSITHAAWSHKITVRASLMNIMQMAGSLVRRKFFNMGIYDNVCFVQMKMKKNLTIYMVYNVYLNTGQLECTYLFNFESLVIFWIWRLQKCLASSIYLVGIFEKLQPIYVYYLMPQINYIEKLFPQHI